MACLPLCFWDKSEKKLSAYFHDDSTYTESNEYHCFYIDSASTNYSVLFHGIYSDHLNRASETSGCWFVRI